MVASTLRSSDADLATVVLERLPTVLADGPEGHILNEAWQKNYWKRKFRVSGQALAGAVRAVGKSAKKVEAYLKNK